MTDRNTPYQPDEPIIGGSTPPPEDPDEFQGYIGDDTDYPESESWADEEDVTAPVIGSRMPPDDRHYAEDEPAGYDDEYYDEYEYYADEPARQPIFYVFVGAALLVGALFIFLLFSLFTGGDDGPAVVTDPLFNVSIDLPLNNDRVNIGDEVQVMVRATSTEQIAVIELFVDGRSVDQELFASEPPDQVYSATLVTIFDAPGKYLVSVRAKTVTGATSDSEELTLVAIEAIDQQPTQITGDIITTVNARSGPGDDYPSVRVLDPGDQVTIEARTPDNDWLLLDDGTWIRRTAVELSDSLVLVPTRRPTPTPAPTATETPEETASPSPSPGADAPDLSPTNATLVSGGAVVRVTISNLASSDYSGPIVVSASGLPNGDIVQVFDREVMANGAVTVDFTVNPAMTEGGPVQISVDPDNAIKEVREDNNDATFVLGAPVEPPTLVVQSATVEGQTVTVVVQNSGGELASTTVVVAIELGGELIQTSSQVALATGQTKAFMLTKPQGTGTATITVSIDGQTLASAEVEIQGENTE